MKEIKLITHTVITGASQGLGKALAFECAERGRNLILISLPNEGIQEFRKYLIEMYAIDVCCYEIDLSKETELHELISTITHLYRVDMLINNAGIGGTKRFQEASENYIDSILSLNIRALVLLTRGLLPLLKKHSKAYVLNISSMASFGAMPFKTVYPASKAFVRSFSVGLATELEDTNIQVSVAYPGGMPTNKEVSERISNHNELVKQTILTAEEVAEICMKELLEGKTEIIPGMAGKISRLFFRVCPDAIRLRIFRKNVLKEMMSYA
ncbi:SDR family NAD(P)-dependent oxidoreductase [Flammeovirga aprica]|uniref:SDR family NAD(P)-dependent oxidoreductase n=1 Tax=Flammeovirga aprica JL-4 TaxID=694437 RepID=A0A7X9RUP7_9BACT|nr:SDR family NAD(P)-dependent oxidoreductase [Flammeovirga aprica]NME69052.1 SDR family NAD(P)-dependent oxidoreductase [Flammeovirga aprica JL-4]